MLHHPELTQAWSLFFSNFRTTSASSEPDRDDVNRANNLDTERSLPGVRDYWAPGLSDPAPRVILAHGLLLADLPPVPQSR
jgi:hypothetical protein